jgi:sterol 3beta-glucosyltransferase
MRISIVSVGSRGDVQPFIALGLGLQQSGHQVTLATRSKFKQFVTVHGLDFAAVERPKRAAAQQKEKDALILAGRNTFLFLYYQLKRLRDSVEQTLVDTWNACQGAEAMVYAVAVPMGMDVAEVLGIPAIAASLFPVTATRAFPMPGIPPAPILQGVYNRLSYVLVEQLAWVVLRSTINHWRQETLHVPPLRRRSTRPFTDPYQHEPGRCLPWIYAFSPHVVPRPVDWPAHIHVTGYWFLDRPATWQPPADLVDFLRAGPPPILIGFGSMEVTRSKRLNAIILEALRRTGKRAIWTPIGNLDAGAQIPAHVFVTDGLPHDWLFPQVSAVIHHGGAGTVAAAMRAGVPSAAVPFTVDHPFWADRIAALGVGPRGVGPKKLTVEGLVALIEQVTGSADVRRRAQALGEQIRAEDGVARAVEVIERSIA